MSVKTTLDAIDLIAARCRIWAASMLTLFVGFEALDITGALDGLIPPGSVWHKIVPIVGMLVARYTHSKQSATAVIEAKADERTTPVTPMGALPAVALLLMASMAFSACGGPVDEPAVKTTTTESALTGSQVWTGYPGIMTGPSYYCGNKFYHARQPMYQTSTGGATPSISTAPNGDIPTSINYARNEYQIQCNWAAMANYPSYAISTSNDTCYYYTHLVNEWWALSAVVKVPAGGLIYYPPGGFAPVTGYWTIYMELPWDGSGPAYSPGLENWGTGYGLSACQVSHTKQIAIY